MSWMDDKDLGPDPWNFVEQPNKWGYLNNPRWRISPAAPVNYDTNPEDEPQVFVPLGGGLDVTYTVDDSGYEWAKVHKPCGHWHKTYTIIVYTP